MFWTGVNAANYFINSFHLLQGGSALDAAESVCLYMQSIRLQNIRLVCHPYLAKYFMLLTLDLIQFLAFSVVANHLNLPCIWNTRKAVRVMEDLEVFDAGVGSFLTRDGTVEMDAFLADDSLRVCKYTHRFLLC